MVDIVTDRSGGRAGARVPTSLVSEGPSWGHYCHRAALAINLKPNKLTSLQCLQHESFVAAIKSNPTSSETLEFENFCDNIIKNVGAQEMDCLW